MQVILRTNVEKLGKLGDVVKVKPGYARNYLIPKKMAMEATPANMRVFEQQRQQLQKRLDEERFRAQGFADKLQQLEIVIPVRVGEHDKLYGSVTNAHIADALAKKGYEIDKKKIELPEPIRSLGDFQVEVKLHPEVRPELTVSVVRHGEEKSSHGEQE
jgi:large subunit ribosomal protein L9